MPKYHTKQPAANKDYDFQWEDWLASTGGDTIASATVAASPTGLTLGTTTITDGDLTVKQFVGGGTSGVVYTLTCTIITHQGRTEEDEILLTVREKS